MKRLELLCHRRHHVLSMACIPIPAHLLPFYIDISKGWGGDYKLVIILVMFITMSKELGMKP